MSNVPRKVDTIIETVPISSTMSPSTTATAPAIDFLQIIDFALRHRWLLIFSMVIGAALGTLYIFQVRPIYRSTAQLLIIKKQTGLQGDSKDGLAQYEALVSRDLLSTQMMVLTSPLVVGRAIQNHNLDKLESLQLLLKPGDGDDLTAKVIKKLTFSKGGIQRDSRDANAVTIKFDGYNKEDTETVLEAIIESYQNFLGESSKDVGENAIDLMEKAKGELRTQLSMEEKAYHDFLRGTKLLRGTKEDSVGNIHTDRIFQIETARSTLQIRYVDAKAHLEELERDIAAGVPKEAILYSVQHGYSAQRGDNVRQSVMQQSSEQTLQARLKGLKVDYETALEKMGPEHPNVRSIRRQIESIRSMLLGSKDGKGATSPSDGAGDYFEHYLISVRKEVKELEARERALSIASDREREASKLLLDEELRAQSLRNDMERTQALFEVIVKRLQEINFVKDYGAYNTQVIAQPQIGMKIAPRAAPILGAALFLGLFGGCVLAFLADSLDQSFRSAQDIRDYLRIPLIGQIPYMKSKHTQISANSTLDASLVCYHRSKSRTAEAYRAVRTAVYFSTSETKCKLIQVTSAEQGDGKSTLAANLAICIAQSGKKTLIIDADLRRPRVHKLFNIPDDCIGLTSVITNAAELGDAIHQTEIDQLWCMPCGPKPSNPSELLTSTEFPELLDCLRDRYDFVIIDTAPMLIVTDSSAVAARVDGVVLAIRLSKNSRIHSGHVVRELHSVGANVLGFVVNGVGSGGTGYKYGYGGRYGSNGYGYTYGYGRSPGYGYGNNDDDRSPYYAENEDEGAGPDALGFEKRSNQPRIASRT